MTYLMETPGNFQVEADVVAPSSRSLAPVPMHLNFSFTENYLDREPTNEENDLLDGATTSAST